MNHITTRCRRTLLVLLAVAGIATGVASSPASAAQYWSNGTTGTATVPQAYCKHYTAWGRLDMAIDPPNIYARNTVAGAGNDAQWVRYAFYVVNSSGVTVQSSSFSSWAVAWDNVRAPFAGATLFTNVPNNSRIDVRIEWWNTGALAYRVEKYSINSNSWFQGLYDSCFKL